MREYCDECGIFSVVNDDGICADCEQEDMDLDDEIDEEDLS